MLLLSFLFPNERKIWPSKTNEQEVNLFKSSALAIFKVSLKKRLKKTKSKYNYVANVSNN